jgi:hypothetical protein
VRAIGRQHVRFIVELRATVDGVAGEVTSESAATPQRFSSWLELLRLIEPPETSAMGDRHEPSRRADRDTATVGLHYLAPVPAAEVSGLATAVVGRRHTLVAVADDTVAVFVSHVSDTASGPEVDQWQTLDLAGAYEPPEQGSNFEGVALDVGGTAVVLAEYPARLLVVGLDNPSTVRVVDIDLSSVARAVGEQFDEEDFRFLGEGLVLCNRGHVLVAREKDPMGLIELAPGGSMSLGLRHDAVLGETRTFAAPAATYKAVAWWPVDGPLEDISDIAVYGDRIYLLSDQSAAVARLPLNGPPPGVVLTPELVCDLATTEAMRKSQNPEGLTFIDNVAVVAFDRGDAEPNLATIRGLAP